MAFNLDFSKSREALGRVTQFLQYDAMQRRASERQQKQAYLESALASDLSTQKYGQDLQLEAFRSANNRTEETNKAILGVLAMPELDAAVSTLNLARAGKLGKEHEPLIKHAKEILENGYKDIGDAVYAVQTGAAGPEHLAQIVKYYGTKGIEYSKELGISLRAIEKNKIDEEANRINASKADLDRANFFPPQVTNEMKLIEKAISSVQAGGVDLTRSKKSMMAAMMGGATGFRVPATLPEDISGIVQEQLSNIYAKINREKRLMTPLESKFVNEALNTWKLRGTISRDEDRPPYDPVGAAGRSAGLSPSAAAAQAAVNPSLVPAQTSGMMDPNTGARATDDAVYAKDAQRAEISVLKKMIQDTLVRPLNREELKELQSFEKLKKEPGFWNSLTLEQKARYDDYYRRAYEDPSEEEELMYLGLAIERYNEMHPEAPIPLPEGYESPVIRQ